MIKIKYNTLELDKTNKRKRDKEKAQRKLTCSNTQDFNKSHKTKQKPH